MATGSIRSTFIVGYPGETEAEFQHLLDWLDDAGLTENTIVIYTSDQGFFLGEHGWFDKRWMYEESLREPLVMRWPVRS